MTTQEIMQDQYERVRVYFTRPGAVLAKRRRSNVPGDVECVYYDAHTGAKCAVGCLLTDRDARALAAGCFGSIRSIITVVAFEKIAQRVSKLLRLDDHEVFEFLADVQLAHDHASTTSVGEFLRRLHQVAQKYNLRVVT